MHLHLSVLSSAIYWISSNLGFRNHICIPAKFIAIFPIALLSEQWFILIIYMIGDLLIFWNIEYSMMAFAFGHWLFVIHNISDIRILLYCAPFIGFSTYVVRLVFPNKLIYTLYIFCLNCILVYAIFESNYMALLFILSDILIGINQLPWMTWPLYYFAVVYSYWQN